MNKPRELSAGLTILVAVTLWCAGAVQGGEVEITERDVSALELRYGLAELLSHLEAQLGEVDPPEARRRKYKLTRAFLSFRYTRRELAHAQEKLKIEQALCSLDSTLVANAQAPDRIWLEARKEVLSQETALLNLTERAQLLMLEILELVPSAEIVPDERADEEAAGNPD